MNAFTTVRRHRLREFVRKWTLPREVRKTIRAVKKDRLTYLSRSRLRRLASLCRSHERGRVPGGVIEAGCALGGSSIVMASAKRKDRKLFVYDVFDVIPPPSAEDGADVQERYEAIRSGQAEGIEGDRYYGYVGNLYEQVIASFTRLGYPPEEHNVTLVKGLLQDTLRVCEAVSLAHIDVDWYEPVRTCLERIEPRLSVGGALVLDDYDDWSGCRRAVDAYFRDKDSARYAFDTSSGSLVITKRR